MKNVDLNTKEADDKTAAYMNARRSSARAQATYTPEQQAIANSAFETIRNTYIRSKCYLTYRTRFISIKVCNPKASDKLYAEPIEQQLAALGVVKATTPQGIIYRIG